MEITLQLKSSPDKTTRPSPGDETCLLFFPFKSDNFEIFSLWKVISRPQKLEKLQNQAENTLEKLQNDLKFALEKSQSDA